MGKAATPEQPEPLKSTPVDIRRLAVDARAADLASYDDSDREFALRNPGIAIGQQESLDSAYKNLTGPLDPTLQSSFVNEGLAKSFNAFGGGNPLAGGGDTGSAGRNTIASTFANRFLENQDYNRGEFIKEIGSNLPRQVGPSGDNALGLYITNANDLNQTNRTNYIGAVNASNAERATSDANTQATISTLLALAGIAAVAFSDKKMKKNIKQVGVSPSGVPIKEFSYKGDDDVYVGGMAQDIEKVFPEAVVQDYKKRKGVVYQMTDVPFYKKHA